MKSFLHCGDLGDIIFSLPTIKALGGGKLYLDELGGLNHSLVKWADRQSTKLNAISCNQLLEVLETQDYIKSWEIIQYDGKTKFDYDLNQFRKHIKYNNLAKSHLAVFNLDLNLANTKWIDGISPKKLDKKYLISRSVRYHGNFSYWEGVLPLIKDDCYFIGFAKEHEIFEYTFGHKVPHYTTYRIKDLIEVIAGAEYFICNQGFPHALAEAMNIPLKCEVYRVYPSAVFENKSSSTYV